MTDDFAPGEGPLTEDEAKAAVEAEAAPDDDVEPPAEPLTDNFEQIPDEEAGTEGD
jgi:hypothetical protein